MQAPTLSARPCNLWSGVTGWTPAARRPRQAHRAAVVPASASSITAEMTVTGDQALPGVYKRLVAKRTGESFSAVAEVEEAQMPQPGPNEVG